MKLVLIGGGDIGKGNTNYETKEIDQKILKLVNKDNPNFLFIGFASTYSDSYYDIIKKIYKNLGCNTTYLKRKNLINNRELSIKKINDADIIYIGGGDTIRLKKTIEEYNLKDILDQQVQNNKVIVGISAGAIILSKSGYSDTYILRGEDNKYRFINGYNYFKHNICPHYNNESKEKQLNKDIKDKEVYCLEDNTALIIDNNKIRVIKSNKNNNIYKISNNKKELINE